MIDKMGGLMKVMPILAVSYVIAGLASLGLPGLSGFVAEMTIFFGAFQHSELFYRIITIVAAASIVITAVYILRVVGQILYGPVWNEDHLKLGDAKWYERLSTGALIFAIAGIGVAPLWLSNMISSSLSPIMHQLMHVFVN